MMQSVIDTMVMIKEHEKTISRFDKLEEMRKGIRAEQRKQRAIEKAEKKKNRRKKKKKKEGGEDSSDGSSSSSSSDDSDDDSDDDEMRMQGHEQRI